MVFYIYDKKLIKEDMLPEGVASAALPCLRFLTPEELSSENAVLNFNDRIVKECALLQTNKFESHEKLDYISLAIPVSEDPVNAEHHVSILFRRDLLLFVCEDPLAIPVFKRLFSRIGITYDEPRNFTLERVLQLFFDDLTYEDSLLLEQIEEEASALEETLITTGANGNYSEKIIILRKKLLAYKRYYDQLSSISATIEENDNQLLTEQEIRFFRILTNRTERLLGGIDNIQDYVSQIREAYQTQIDIDQNSIMKFFTVITAVFLPLTLIVGWYGMNFDMPEYRSPYGYPVIVALCAAVAVGSLIYFKKHRWF